MFLLILYKNYFGIVIIFLLWIWISPYCPISENTLYTPASHDRSLRVVRSVGWKPLHRKQLRSQQSKCLCTVVGAPRYVRNATMQRDLLDEFIAHLPRGCSIKQSSSFFPTCENWRQHEWDHQGKAYPGEILATTSTETTSHPHPLPTTGSPPGALAGGPAQRACLFVVLTLCPRPNLRTVFTEGGFWLYHDYMTGIHSCRRASQQLRNKRRNKDSHRTFHLLWQRTCKYLPQVGH